MKKIWFLLILLPYLGISQTNYITNKDYREFVEYVRDSLFRYTMGNEVNEEAYHTSTWDSGNYTAKDTFVSVNWKTKLDINSPEAREALEFWYYAPLERFNRKREIDVRKLNHNNIAVFPDELIWCKDTTNNISWANFLTRYYFTNSHFDNYPVQGLNNQQIREYLKWKYPKSQRSTTSSVKDVNIRLPREKLKVTVNEYISFYRYTRDSVVRTILCQELDEWKYCLSVNKYSEEINPPIVKWKNKIKWKDKTTINILKQKNILTSENTIDNRYINFQYDEINFHHLPITGSKSRDNYFSWILVNLMDFKYLKQTSNIKIGSQLKSNSELNYHEIDKYQLKAFFWWKKSTLKSDDVFEGFIPYNDDIISIQKGNLPDSFLTLRLH